MQETGFSLWIASPLHDKEKVGQWLNLIAHSNGLQFPKQEGGGLLGNNKATDSEHVAPAETRRDNFLNFTCAKLFNGRLPPWAEATEPWRRSHMSL